MLLFAIPCELVRSESSPAPNEATWRPPGHTRRPPTSVLLWGRKTHAGGQLRSSVDEGDEARALSPRQQAVGGDGRRALSPAASCFTQLFTQPHTQTHTYTGWYGM